ncbi:hypothetical protein, partial [Halomonas sp. NO4]|uniref:hypothetical protein n=1 Tax=Halomonas sp. NO4 TaxID=2484813 RepID=UPI001969F4C0
VVRLDPDLDVVVDDAFDRDEYFHGVLAWFTLTNRLVRRTSIARLGTGTPVSASRGPVAPPRRPMSTLKPGIEPFDMPLYVSCKRLIGAAPKNVPNVPQPQWLQQSPRAAASGNYPSSGVTWFVYYAYHGEYREANDRFKTFRRWWYAPRRR